LPDGKTLLLGKQIAQLAVLLKFHTIAAQEEQHSTADRRGERLPIQVFLLVLAGYRPVNPPQGLLRIPKPPPIQG